MHHHRCPAQDASFSMASGREFSCKCGGPCSCQRQRVQSRVASLRYTHWLGHNRKPSRNPLQPDRGRYDGETDNDGNFQGFGVYTVLARGEYQGEWHQGKRHGKGVETYTDGRTYEGEFQCDLKSGYGVFDWPDGRRYEGHWRSDMSHGQGTFRAADGSEYSGGWKEGRKDGEGWSSCPEPEQDGHGRRPSNSAVMSTSGIWKMGRLASTGTPAPSLTGSPMLQEHNSGSSGKTPQVEANSESTAASTEIREEKPEVFEPKIDSPMQIKVELVPQKKFESLGKKLAKSPKDLVKSMLEKTRGKFQGKRRSGRNAPLAPIRAPTAVGDGTLRTQDHNLDLTSKFRPLPRRLERSHSR